MRLFKVPSRDVLKKRTRAMLKSSIPKIMMLMIHKEDRFFCMESFQNSARAGGIAKNA